MSRFKHRRALLWATLATSLFAGWQQLTVTRNFGGNWTALFNTGSEQEVPPGMSKGTLRTPDPHGFDGQMYRYIAHDPFLAGEAHRYADDPALRGRRILVPGLAWLLALGQDAWIDCTYVVVIWAFCFCGVYWIARVLAVQSVSQAFSILFLLLPATLITADRLVIDMPFSAITAGVIWASLTGNRSRLLIFLSLTALCRETGLVLIAGIVTALLFKKDWRTAVQTAYAAVPAAFWFAFISLKTSSVRLPETIGMAASVGPLVYLFHPADYPLPSIILPITQNLDRIAILSVFLSLALVLALWLRRPNQTILFATFVLGAASFAATLDPIYWDSSYNYLRLFSPIFLTLGLAGAPGSPRWFVWLAPAAFADLRILLQLAPQIIGIASPSR